VWRTSNPIKVSPGASAAEVARLATGNAIERMKQEHLAA
jgi:hypothetical protein